MKREAFVKKIASELAEDNLAVFIGAGLSIASGGVSWSKLLKIAADELGLDIKRESDLISLTQFYVNSKNQNKGGLAQHIYDSLNLNTAEPNINHKLLAKMPISSYWTTNYDKLIEKSLEQESKLPDVKYDPKQFVRTLKGRDAVVYKMHGDIDHPSDVIITRTDFEKYHISHSQFLSTLYGDLTAKTFLFLGISFTDPNLFYVLSRVRAQFETGQREHYAIIKKFERDDFDSDSDFEYAIKRQPYFVNDLVNYNITVLLVDSHDDTTNILREVERLYRRNTIFISGSAHEYGSYKPEGASKILEDVIDQQFKNRRRIINGYGLGFGDLVVGAAIRKISNYKFKNPMEYIIVRPFPQGSIPLEIRQEVWRNYRQDMIERSGIALFMFGNKINGDEIALADGMYQEFQISKENGLLIVPIGATGYMARKIWQEVKDDFESYYPNADDALKDQFERLNQETDPESLSMEINKFIGFIYERSQ
ncbi:SIR2 family protein [uncultured Deinococcus sp.]|uniref:SIR2 family protein n=1 Tax=uncultured Deinococcus sp. TaxID=158789 RepID=UPI0025F5F4FD|nr:SIR2 family protein [uncultured Deinococcus sp.]